MTGIETFGWFAGLLILIPISAVLAWCGFVVLHWVVNSEVLFLRTALILSIIIIAKFVTPAVAAADELDVLADQLLEQASEAQLEEGMDTIRQIYDAIGGTQQDFRTVMDNLSIETDDVPVTMYRFINYCLAHTLDIGQFWFFKIDHDAATRFGVHVRRW